MKFKDNDFINLDYSDIKDEVRKNIRTETEKRKKFSFGGFNLKKALSYALCIMLTCVVSVGSTLLIQGSMFDNNGENVGNGIVGDINPDKNLDTINNDFDEFYIFCGGATESVSIDRILKTELISETDKETLKSYCVDNSLGEGIAHFNIYMGLKDGKDIIVFSHLCAPYQMFAFDSNLSYSLKSVVEKFEEISGEMLTREFLKSSFGYKGFSYELGGITMRFVNWHDESYVKRTFVEYYTAIIGGKVYILPSSQLVS